MEMPKDKPLQRPPGYREPGLPIQKPSTPQLKAKLPASFYPRKKKKRGSCCCRLCCWFLIVTVLLTLFFISFGGFLYLWYEPRVPGFSLKSFQVEKFNVTGGPGGPRLDSQTSIELEFKNANKKLRFVYGKTSVFLNASGLSGDLDMGRETVPGFVQGENNVTVVKFVVKGNQGLNENDAKRVRDQFRAKSLVMTMEVRTGIGLEFNGPNTVTVGIKVVCGASSLRDIQGGAMPPCKVFAFDSVPIY